MTDDTQPQAIAEFSEHRHALATSRNDATHDLREAQQRAEAATAKLGGDPGNATLLKAALAARQQARDAADVLDELAAPLAGRPEPAVADLAAAAGGVRRAALARWLAERGARDVAAHHVRAVEALVVAWRGQRGVDVPGGRVLRRDARLVFDTG